MLFMVIERVRLNNYRNYDALNFAPGPGVNIITGENAQGKTNAVEAIFLCAFGRSHRTTRDSELVKNGCAGGYVGLKIKSNQGAHAIEIKLRDGMRKEIYIDTLKAARTGELMGVLNVVMFSPEDLQLIKEGPALRRRFMDMEISQLHPSYYYHLQQYNAALKQRNALLKGDPSPGAKLFMWDAQLAEAGAKIMTARGGFLSKLHEQAKQLHFDITGGREWLEIVYRPNIEVEKNGDTLSKALLDGLSNSANEDMRRGFTTVGPHRDDMAITLNGQDVRVYGSQGQQRTAALSIKLSEIELLRTLTGDMPVLILDDVLSELDDMRSRLLVERMRDCQCFLTCTSLEGLKRAGILEMSAFVCEGGTLTRG